jgi:hypothetical protein
VYCTTLVHYLYISCYVFSEERHRWRGIKQMEGTRQTGTYREEETERRKLGKRQRGDT